MPDDLPRHPTSADEGYEHRRQHVLWYGGAVIAVLLAIIVLQVVT